MEPQGINQHPLILAFDFPGRREEATFAHAFERMPERRWCLVTVTDRHAHSRVSYIEAASALAAGETIAAVAFCAAAPLAQDVMATLRARGHDTGPLVLADPVLPNRSHSERAVREIFEQIQRPQAAEECLALLDDDHLTSEPLLWREAVLETLRCQLATSLDCTEHDDVVTGLAQRYVSYLDFLLAAQECQCLEYPGPVTMVLSANHTFTEPWPGIPAPQAARSGSDRRTLLASETFRRHLLEATTTIQ